MYLNYSKILVYKLGIKKKQKQTAEENFLYNLCPITVVTFAYKFHTLNFNYYQTKVKLISIYFKGIVTITIWWFNVTNVIGDSIYVMQ